MKRLSTQCMNEIENKTNRKGKQCRVGKHLISLPNLRGFIIQNPLYARNSVV